MRMFDDPLYLISIMTGFIRRFVETQSGTPEFHTYFAEFLFKQNHNVFAAHTQLNLAKGDLLSKSLRFKQFYLKKTIKIEVNPNEVGNKK